MNSPLSLDGQPIDTVTLRIDRQQLVDQFNVLLGAPGDVVAALQRDFIDGKMPYGEMVSYIRFCENMMLAAEARDATGPRPTPPNND